MYALASYDLTKVWQKYLKFSIASPIIYHRLIQKNTIINHPAVRSTWQAATVTWNLGKVVGEVY